MCTHAREHVCKHVHAGACVLAPGEVGAGCYTFILEAQIPLRNEIDIIPNRTPEPRENFKKHLKCLI